MFGYKFPLKVWQWEREEKETTKISYLRISSSLYKRWVCCRNLSRVFLTLLWVMRVYIVWVKGIRVTLKILAVSAFRKSSHELAKSRDESWNSLTLQLLAFTSHVTFLGYTTCEPSREINFLINLHQLNTKPNTIKSHKIQENESLQLQHFLPWNKVNIKHSCKS